MIRNFITLTSHFWWIYTIYDIIKAALVAFVIAFIFTPIAKWFAKKIGAVDVPKDNRRMHKKPIPRAGGLAIFIGVVASIEYSIGINQPEIIAIFIGALILVILGLVDDCLALSAKLKLGFQIIAAAIPIYMGVRVSIISNPFASNGMTKLPLWLSILITMLWIIGTTNAVNLIDGLDGLACGVSCIASIFIGYIAFKNNQFEAFWMALAVSAACLGFLPFNFNPAKIFMGDTGSTFLGYMLAIISVHGAVKGTATLVVLVPLLALGLPIFDTAFAIMRRAVSGRPIMSPDRGHLHHRLIDKGLSQKQAVLIMYGVSILLGICATIAYKSIYIRRIMVYIAPIIIIAVIFMYVKVFSIKPEDEKHKE